MELFAALVGLVSMQTPWSGILTLAPLVAVTLGGLWEAAGRKARPGWRRWQTWARYGVALASVALATGFRVAIDPVLKDNNPLLTFFFAVVITAWHGGLGPTLLAVGLSGLVGNYLFMQPRGVLELTGLAVQLGVGQFVFVGVACALLSEAQRQARLRAEAAAREALSRQQQLLSEIAERQRVEQALRRSEAQLRQLADVMPQIVWVTRPDGYHEYYNQRWYEYTGLSVAESIGHQWNSPLHPDDREHSIARWKESLATGSPYEVEYRFRGRDGGYRWFLGRALPVCDEEGTIIRWFGTCTDIDDRRRQAELLEQRVRERTAELEAANQALSRSNRELEQFASVASHDLQEPLRKIQAFGDRLRQRCGGELGEQGQDYLNRMQNAAARMSTLINDLLAFSRVTTRGQPFTACDLDQVARGVVSDLEGRLQETGGAVEVGPLPGILADPTQLRQLLQNLIGNALKFHQPGTPPLVRVRGRLHQDDGEAATLHLEVEDNGIGFDEKYLDRIFNVFERLHARDQYEGTGVGLAICRKIVERHGGHITARSRPGQGTTFLVTLPADPNERRGTT